MHQAVKPSSVRETRSISPSSTDSMSSAINQSLFEDQSHNDWSDQSSQGCKATDLCHPGFQLAEAFEHLSLVLRLPLQAFAKHVHPCLHFAKLSSNALRAVVFHIFKRDLAVLAESRNALSVGRPFCPGLRGFFPAARRRRMFSYNPGLLMLLPPLLQ